MRKGYKKIEVYFPDRMKKLTLAEYLPIDKLKPFEGHDSADRMEQFIKAVGA